jgi:pimeloyl-ACP methyl ester carboxylesterase
MVLFGQSLGAAIAIVVAADRNDLAGLAVEGAFARYRDAVEFVARQNWLLWPVAGIVSRAMFSDTHNPIDYAPNLPAIPKLFISGTADSIVNHQDTVDLHNRSGEPKVNDSRPSCPGAPPTANKLLHLTFP